MRTKLVMCNTCQGSGSVLGPDGKTIIKCTACGGKGSLHVDDSDEKRNDGSVPR